MTRDEFVIAVVIGRNEEKRLGQSIQSLKDQVDKIIYVDSDSSDSSVKIAKNLADKIIVLNRTDGFTAAKARNTGFLYIKRNYPWAKYIQFVDGDCRVSCSWVSSAVKFLDKNHDYGIVSGSTVEEFPDSSIYNLLCYLEFDHSSGEKERCAGNALIRVKALDMIGGYNSNMIAGEEAEMSLRIKQAGWRIWQIEQDMVYHDVALDSFSKWWKRMLRGGIAIASGIQLHGIEGQNHLKKMFKSAIFWGGVLPILFVVSFFISVKLTYFIILLYLVQTIRIALKTNVPFPKSLLAAIFLMIAKFAEIFGILKYFLFNWIRFRKF